MTLEMVTLQLYLPTGGEKNDTNSCKSIRKESACLLSLKLMEVANTKETYGIITPVE